jgi:hypothetical protein
VKAFRVWSTWADDPELEGMASAAFEKRERAQTIADVTQADHERAVGRTTTCHYVVREEEIPRDYVHLGVNTRVVLAYLGDDDQPTNMETT